MTGSVLKAIVVGAGLAGYVVIAVRWGWVVAAITFVSSVVLGLAATYLGDWRDERIRRQIRRRQEERRPCA